MKFIKYFSILLLLFISSIQVFTDNAINLLDYKASVHNNDYTKALKDALRDAKNKKTNVIVPPGRYFITEPIPIPDKVGLIGDIAVTYTSDIESSLPVLVFDKYIALPGGFILGHGSTINGFLIRYSTSVAGGYTRPSNKQATTIKIIGIGVRINNIKIFSPWIGIGSDNNDNIGRFDINNIWMIHPFNGVIIGCTLDCSKISNVHLWNNGNFETGSHGFIFRRNDYMSLTDCSVFNMNTAMFLDVNTVQKHQGGNVATMNGFVTDACSTGVYSHGEQKVSFSGCTLINHWHGIQAKGNSNIQITGSYIKNNSAQCIYSEFGSRVIVSGCEIISRDSNCIYAKNYSNISISGCNLSSNNRKPIIQIYDSTNLSITGSNLKMPNNGCHSIRINKGNCITITGCTINMSGYGIYVDQPPYSGLTITGNVFDYYGNTHSRILVGNYGNKAGKFGNITPNNNH